MLNWFKPKFNVENILPEIEETLRQFDYQGLTDKDDPINAIAMDIMSDDSVKHFINIYQFKVDGQQFYICDKAFRTGMEAPVHMCMLATGKSYPLGFELANHDYFINNDCKTIEKIDQWRIRVEERDEYEEHKGLLISLLPSLEQFTMEGGYNISFLSFPRDNIVGYHVEGRRMDTNEIAVVASLIRRFP